MLLVAKKANASDADEIELSRQQILNNPAILERIRQVSPELARAAQQDPARFRRLFEEMYAPEAQRRRQQQLAYALSMLSSWENT